MAKGRAAGDKPPRYGKPVTNFRRDTLVTPRLLLGMIALSVGSWAAACIEAGPPIETPRLTDAPATPATTTPAPSSTGTPTETPVPTPTPGLGREWARVLRVWDGSSVLIEGGLSVRYIGVLTPGAGMFGRPVEPFGREAAERNAALVEGRQVEIEEDVSDVDEVGFLLRYVYVDGVMVSELLLREGLARLSALGANTKYRGLLEEAEAAARSGPRNIWTIPTPTGTPTPTPTPMVIPTAVTPQRQASPTGTPMPVRTVGTPTPRRLGLRRPQPRRRGLGLGASEDKQTLFVGHNVHAVPA